jgi:hypothetical protein
MEAIPRTDRSWLLGKAFCLAHRAVLKAGLKAIAHTRLGYEKARVIRIGLDFLSQFANENPQVLDIVSLIAPVRRSRLSSLMANI